MVTPENEDRNTRLLRKYIDENANLGLIIKQRDIQLEDKTLENDELRRQIQELQAQLNDGDASQMEA